MLGIFGKVTNPFNVLAPDATGYSGTNGEGLITLLSNLVKVAIVGAGLYTLFNIVLAGYGFLTAQGDPKAYQKSTERIWRSFVGLLIVASTYLIAGLMGYIIFGRQYWDILINPRIFTAGP